MAKDKEYTSKFNPFNSDKLFAQIHRWRGIKDWEDGNGELPAPTTVSIDPANICDLSCENCNAEFLMQRNHNLLSRKTLMDIANFFPLFLKMQKKFFCLSSFSRAIKAHKRNNHKCFFLKTYMAMSKA